MKWNKIVAGLWFFPQRKHLYLIYSTFDFTIYYLYDKKKPNRSSLTVYWRTTDAVYRRPNRPLRTTSSAIMSTLWFCGVVTTPATALRLFRSPQTTTIIDRPIFPRRIGTRTVRERIIYERIILAQTSLGKNGCNNK